jgi:hypothetical protein
MPFFNSAPHLGATFLKNLDYQLTYIQYVHKNVLSSIPNIMENHILSDHIIGRIGQYYLVD